METVYELDKKKKRREVIERLTGKDPKDLDSFGENWEDELLLRGWEKDHYDGKLGVQPDYTGGDSYLSRTCSEIDCNDRYDIVYDVLNQDQREYCYHHGCLHEALEKND